jgi:hypothetical protein
MSEIFKILKHIHNVGIFVLNFMSILCQFYVNFYLHLSEKRGSLEEMRKKTKLDIYV